MVVPAWQVHQLCSLCSYPEYHCVPYDMDIILYRYLVEKSATAEHRLGVHHIRTYSLDSCLAITKYGDVSLGDVSVPNNSSGSLYSHQFHLKNTAVIWQP